MAKLTQDAFNWPDSIKQSISKHRSPHFLGFTGIGDERTNNGVDQREVRMLHDVARDHTDLSPLGPRLCDGWKSDCWAWRSSQFLRLFRLRRDQSGMTALPLFTVDTWT